MKRILIAVTAAAFVFASCNSGKKTASGADSITGDSAAKVAPEDAPIIKFEKTSYDFGKITEGEKVSYDFKFTNAGKSPLIISNATASCGCTVPDYHMNQ